MSLEMSYRFKVMYALNENWIHLTYLDAYSIKQLKELIKTYAKDHKIQYDQMIFECID